MDYYSFTFQIKESWQQELIIAALDDIGFEGYEERENAMDAYISTSSFSESAFIQAITPYQEAYGFSFSKSIVENKNWNELWEKSFNPIVIGSEIAVRASFHPSFPEVKYDLVIDPKMSFGTGHHATTEMMMRLMLKENISQKRVLDFGSGTGILSILAAKLNANTILSIDHEEWAYRNAIENFQLNHVVTATALLGDASCFKHQEFDLILANINRSIIVNTMSQFAATLNKHGRLLISGF